MSLTYLLTFALQNIFVANRTRYVFIILLLVMSIVFAMLGLGFVDGMEYGILRGQKNIVTSDIVYRPKTSKDYVQLTQEERRVLDQNTTILWTPRLQSSVTLHIPSKHSTAIQIIGFSPNDSSVFQYQDVLTKGDWNKNAVGVGVGLAQKHDLQIGDDVVLETQSHSGSLTAQKHTINAIVDTGNFAFHHILWLPYKDISTLIGTDMVGSIHVKGPKNCQLNEISLPNWDCYTAKEEAAGMLQINMIRKRVFESILVILWFVSLSSLFHITWMSVHERRSEIHTLRTLGTHMYQIIQILMIEGFVIGVLAVVLGISISYILCDWIFIDGIILDGLSTSLGNIPLPRVIFVLFQPNRALLVSAFCLLVTTLISLPSLFWLRYRRGVLC
jgi:ABC-type lipoprotein release transport system permease subunit